MKTISGNIVDVINRRIFKGSIHFEEGVIVKIEEKEVAENQYILPGLVDAHIHIESSMLIPQEFARAAVLHGTVATVSDPHEIANVLGADGVKFMIENGKKTPFKFYFGAPSCVPATDFETSGARLDANDIEEILRMDEVKYLGEMMNFPGVILEDQGVISKLKVAQKYNKPIDGHAPAIVGEQLEKYVKSGITTDHECSTIAEALDKIALGMKIQIREGSAAKNFEALHPLFKTHPQELMLCSDDRHPDDLLKGHVDLLIKRALQKGYDLFDVLATCTSIPKQHYKLENGLLQQGDAADFIIIDNLDDFSVKSTWINGQMVAENKQCLFHSEPDTPINNFVVNSITEEDLQLHSENGNIKLIKAIEGELITQSSSAKLSPVNGMLISDTKQDILKIVVLNRYQKQKPSIAFIQGFGLKKGAMASTIAHDSHNIIAIGVDDKSLLKAIESVQQNKGGITYCNADEAALLPLEYAGIMSAQDAKTVADLHHQVEALTHKNGCQLKAPFMTLSFMALLVIPEIKISDKGLFDGKNFTFCDLILNK